MCTLLSAVFSFSILIMSLKVKLRRNGLKASRVAVLEVICEFGVKCSKLHIIDDQVMLLFCNSHVDVDRIFSSECMKKLSEIDCDPRVPPDLQAKRSIIVRKLDNFIYEQCCDDIGAEIERSNDGLHVRSVHKFPNSKTMKITFLSQEMVGSCLQRGFFIFKLMVSPADIFREEFINLMICYRCYKWNSHPTDSCDKDKSSVVCSLCSSNQHSFRNCDSDIRLCLNCKGQHPTLSFACPHRKEAARAVACERSSAASTSAISPSRSFSSAVRSSGVVGDDIGDRVVKSSMCILLASLKHNEEGTDFAESLQNLLKLNGLPSLNVGDYIPPSLRIGEGTPPAREDTPPTSQGMNSQRCFSATASSVAVSVPCPNLAPLPKTNNNTKSSSQKENNETLIRGDSEHDIRSNNDSVRRTMKIFKRKGTRDVNAKNIRTLASAGKVLIESGSLSERECLDILSGGGGGCVENIFNRITELSVHEFAKKLSGSTISSVSTRSSIKN